jgi:hypothetical protein
MTITALVCSSAPRQLHSAIALTRSRRQAAQFEIINPTPPIANSFGPAKGIKFILQASLSHPAGDTTL